MKAIYLLTFLISLPYLFFSQTPEVSITTGHSSIIMRIALAPTGNLIASNGPDHIIKIWDRSSGKEITSLSNKVEGIDNEQRLNHLKFFDDGIHLLTTDENGTIKVWDIKKEKTIHSFSGGRTVPGLDADIVGRKVIYIDDSYRLAVADLDNLPEKKFPNVKARLILANPKNADQVFIVDLQNNYFIYDIGQKKIITEFKKTETYVYKAAISNNGKYLAIIYNDMSISVWDIKSGSLIKNLTLSKPLEIQFHPVTNELMILNNDPGSIYNRIEVYDTKKFELKRKIENIGLFATFMNLSKNGKYIAINSMVQENKAMSYTINLIDWKSGQQVSVLKSKANSVWQLEAAKNSPKIAALGSDLNLRIWNISTLQIEKVIPFVQKISINQDGNILALQGYYKDAPGYTAIAFWDIDKAEYTGYIPFSDLLSDMKFCADNKHIITSAVNNEIAVWNIETKEKIISFQGTGYGNQRAHISPDLKYIAYGSSGLAGIHVYNTENKEILKINEAHKYLGASDLKFSSNGNFLISGSFDQEAAAWETGTWKKIMGYSGNIGPIYSININNDDEYLASGAMGSTVTESDYAVTVWKASQENPVCKLIGHDLAVNSVTFNNQNRLLFSGSNDGTIRIWSLDSCKEIMSCISIGYDDYIFVTPDYYYTGSKDALKGVGFKMNGTKLYPFEQYDLRLNRPDVIAERLKIAPENLIKAFKRAYQKRLEKMGYKENMLNNDFNIPTLIIKNKEDIAFKMNSDELTLDVSAYDETYKLNRINVWINDVPVYGRAGIDLKSDNSNTSEKRIKLKLSSGKNKIQVSVLNSKGAESLKETLEIIAPEQQQKPDLYIIAVGVSDYMNDNIDLNYAAKDAEDLTSIFKNKNDRFRNIHIIKVLDHEATKENILKTKEELMKSNINDLVIVYTAGHGFLDDKLDYYFATTDVDIDDIPKKGLAYDELESLLDNIPARKKLLMMDACHSGEIDPDEYKMHMENMSGGVVARSVYTSRTTDVNIGLDNSFRLMKELFADLRRGSGAVVISSAGGVEYAFESDKLKNGVFTYVLINALQSRKANANGDGKITISELQRYVMKTVSELTRGMQNPTTRQENLEFDFIVW